MVNKHVVDKTVSGHESLFTGLFVFLLYADSRQEMVTAALSFSAEDTTDYCSLSVCVGDLSVLCLFNGHGYHRIPNMYI